MQRARETRRARACENARKDAPLVAGAQHGHSGGRRESQCPGGFPRENVRARVRSYSPGASALSARQLCRHEAGRLRASDKEPALRGTPEQIKCSG